MLIIHADQSTTVLSHDGEEFHADAAGRFDVPEDLGRALVSFPHWTEWNGTQELVDADAAVSIDAPDLPEGVEELKAADLRQLCADRALAVTGPTKVLLKRLQDWQAARTPADA